MSDSRPRDETSASRHDRMSALHEQDHCPSRAVGGRRGRETDVAVWPPNRGVIRTGESSEPAVFQPVCEQSTVAGDLYALAAWIQPPVNHEQQLPCRRADCHVRRCLSRSPPHSGRRAFHQPLCAGKVRIAGLPADPVRHRRRRRAPLRLGHRRPARYRNGGPVRRAASCVARTRLSPRRARSTPVRRLRSREPPASASQHRRSANPTTRPDPAARPRRRRAVGFASVPRRPRPPNDAPSRHG